MPDETRISRRHFLKLMGYLGVVSIGGLASFAELYKKRGSFPPLVSPSGSSPSGSSLNPLQSAFAQTGGGGTWSLGQNTTVVAIHAALTYTGKIFYLAGSGYCINNETGPYTARLLDPTTGSESTVSMSDDLWCGGAAQLPNGNILFVGGTKLYDIDVNNCNGQWHGGNAAYEFDVPSGTLIKQTSMAHGRWYPTLVTLPNGNVIVVSGSDEYGSYNYLPEVYNSSSKSWTIQYDPTSNNTYCVGAGQTAACPGAGAPCYGGPNQGTTPWLSLYPRMNLMPTGLVFQSGQIQATNLWDPVSGAWTTVNTTSQYRDYGTGILLPLQNTTTENGKVMIVGGSVTFDGAATTVVEIEDFNQGTSRAPVLRTGPSLNNGRKYILPIILPNGKIAVFGGTSAGTTNYVFIPEMFDPENEAQGWATLPAATVGRTYHGTALLLPDGSVWTASSTPNPCTANENRTEIFKPDYFSATRPTISGTPTVGGYGQSITIPTPNPSGISRVSLVRLGATTHHFDTNVRLIWLQITGTGSNTVTVSAPLNASLAPPGYYMIHVLDASRVPSIAQIIQIPGTGSGVSNPPAQVTGVAVATAGSTQLNLSWTANTEPDLNHYNIYRSTTYGFAVNTATDTPIASPTTNSYSDTGLTASTTYYYKVAAVNNSGLIGAVSTQAFGDTAPTTITGQHAVVLDGVVQYINGGTSPTLQVGETAGSEASYSMWVKYHQVSPNPGVFMRRGPTGSFVPYLGSNGVLGCDVHYNTQTADFFNGGALSTDTWHHVVITHSNITNTTALYVDGASVASSAKADFLLNTGPNRLLMGATVLTDTTQTNFFSGLVDDARVYSTALSSAEVSSLFTGSNITRGLVSRWTFDEGTGTVANDSVGTNTATLSPADGAPAWTSDVPAALSGGGGGTGPAQVTGVAVATAGSTQLNLSWTANTEPDLNHYNIYRSTTYGFAVNTATDTPIASPTTNSYSDTGLTASTTYYYKVAAVNNSGLIGAVSTQAFGDTAPTTITGQHAVVLDGVVQYINGGTSPTLQVGETAGSEASYSMWVKYHQVSPNPGVFMRRGPTGSFVPYLGSNGVLGCDVHYNTQTADFFNGGALSTDTWHHVVITHSNITNTTALYVDGASVASSAKADFLLNTGPNRLLMGATVLTDTTQTNFFSGLVDDARVYSTALSSAEVSSLFTGSNITRGLVSRWTFDEGTGTVANDSVGTNTATLSPADGAPAWTSDVPAALTTGGTAPAQVTGVTVATAGSTQLNLSWTANTEPDLNHYNIYRSTTNGFTVNTATDTPIASPTTNSYSDTGLTASTTYYYKVAAVNNSAVIGPVSVQASGTTAGAAPAQVTGVAVATAGSTQLNLSWTANTEPDLNHYNIYRSTTNGFTVNTATDTPIASPTTNSYSDTGLTASTTYYYKVAAVNNSALIGIPSVQASGETGPAQVTGVTVTTQTGSAKKLNLAWTKNTAPDLNHYNIYRSTTNGFTVNTATDTPIAQPTTNSYIDTTGLNPSTTYYYRISAVSNAGTIGLLSAQASGETGPDAVTGVTVTTQTGSAKKLILAWTKNTAPDINHYNIYRSTTNGFTVNQTTAVPIAKPTTNSYTDTTGLNPSTTYYYRISAVSNAGTIGLLSAQASGETGPDAVTGVTATPGANHTLNLAWTKNTAPDINHYNIYRSKTNGFTVNQTTAVPIAKPTTNSYTDTGLTPFTTYYYRISAVSNAGTIGLLSAQASGTTGA